MVPAASAGLSRFIIQTSPDCMSTMAILSPSGDTNRSTSSIIPTPISLSTRAFHRHRRT